MNVSNAQPAQQASAAKPPAPPPMKANDHDADDKPGAGAAGSKGLLDVQA